MHNFRKIILRVCVLALFIVLLEKAGRYIYFSVGDNTYFMTEDLKEQKGTIETLFVGTSLTHRGIDPEIINENMDTVSFNLASSAQPLAGSYYLIKDQAGKNPVKRVFIGISSKSFLSDEDSKSTVSKLRAFDLIQSPFLKASYMFETGEPKEYERFLFFPARVSEKLDMESITRNVTYKQTEAYKQHITYPDSFLMYYGNGFQTSTAKYDGSKAKLGIVEASVWNRENLLEENLEWFRRIARFCQDNDIELNLVVFPHAEEFAMKQGDLADMDAWLEEFCTELGSGLYNYNYTAHEDIYDIFPDECFMDRKHLNKEGAERMSQLLCADYVGTH